MTDGHEMIGPVHGDKGPLAEAKRPRLPGNGGNTEPDR